MYKNTIKKICFIVIAFTLAGCSQTGDAADNEKKLSGKSISVVTTYGPNDGGTAAFKALREEFSQNTGALITDNSADSTESWKKSVIESFDNGQEPDVLFFFTGPDADAIIQNGKFVSFDEIRNEFPDYASNINLTVLDGLKSTDGKNYAVPIKGYWERVFVNADIFEKLNLPLPESYDDLFEIAPALKDAGITPIAASLGEVPHYLFEALLFNMTGPGEHLTVPANSANPPESWVSALEQFNVMSEAGMFPDNTNDITHAEAFELFQSKKAAMIVDGDWTSPQIRDTENTVVINFPSVNNEVRKNTDLISGFSMGFYITKKAWDDPEKREAAVAFASYITSNESIMNLNVSGAAMPISVQASDSDSEAAAESPMRSSIDNLNLNTTAFVGAIADKMNPDARAYLFEGIPAVADGTEDAGELLKMFITLNNR